MRIGAIFARGSCRALKWMALFGVVFALGADSASAQIERVGTNKKYKVTEGEYISFEVQIKGTVAAGATGGTVSLGTLLDTNPAGNSDGTDGDFTGSTNPRSGDPTVADGLANINGSDAIGEQGIAFRFPTNATGTEAKNHTVKGTLSMLAAADRDAEDEIGAIRVFVSAVSGTITPTGGGAAFAVGQEIYIGTLTIDDSDEQTFEWVSPNPASPKEGASAAITVRAVPAPTNYTWNIQARSDSTRYPMGSDTESSSGFDLATADVTQVLNVGGTGVDGEREDTDVMVTLYYTGTNEQLPGSEPYTFKFKDIHKLPAADKITWKAYASTSTGGRSSTEVTSITEGAEHPVHVVVEVDRGTDGYPEGEMLKVTPMAMDNGQRLDYRTEDAPIPNIAAGNGKKTGTFKVWALADDDVGAEDLVLDLKVEGVTATNGPGEVMAAKSVSLAIEDETAPLLTTKTDAEVMAAVAAGRMAGAGDDDQWAPGESFELMESDLFNMVDGNAIQLAASSSSEAVAVSTSGDTVMLRAMSVGTSTITVTGTVTGSSAVMQTVANVAEVEFDVKVDQLVLQITLSGPEDMNIAEGMSAMVTATANRAVTENTTVELFGTGGSASANDWSAEDITILFGETTGTTMLMANEDSMEESMETVTIEGRFGTMKTNMLTFNLWDAAVPALPVIAQLLLAAFLAIGGYRRYLRRR